MPSLVHHAEVMVTYTTLSEQCLAGDDKFVLLHRVHEIIDANRRRCPRRRRRRERHHHRHRDYHRRRQCHLQQRDRPTEGTAQS